MSEEHIEATLRHVRPAVAALARLQLLTGARPAELVDMIGAHLDTSGKVWLYRPPKHKTAHHGHKREIRIGPRAQAILRPWLKADLNARIFDGYTVASYRRAIARAAEIAFPAPGELARKRLPGHGRKATSTRWESRREWKARLERAGRWAELVEWRTAHHWCPLMVRHTAATRIRAGYGLELSQTFLGHKTGSKITEIYAEANVAKAMKIVAEVG